MPCNELTASLEALYFGVPGWLTTHRLYMGTQVPVFAPGANLSLYSMLSK